MALFTLGFVVLIGGSVAQVPMRESSGTSPQSRKYLRELEAQLGKLRTEEAAYERIGDYKKANVCYSRMIAAGATVREVDRTRYALYEKEGQTFEAYRAIKNAVTDTPTSLSTDAVDPVLLIRYGTLAETIGKRDEASDAYRKAVAVGPHYMDTTFYPVIEDSSSSHEVKAAAYFVAAFARLSKGKTNDAILSFRSAVKLDPHNWLPHFGLAFALHRSSIKGLPEEGVRELNRALSLVPAEDESKVRYQAKLLGFPDDTGFINIATIDKNGKMHIKAVRSSRQRG